MITVVVCSYRYGHLAAHCIESLLSQTKQPDKIMFVDDGVGDCHHLKKIYPNVEYVFREKNLGIDKNFDDMLRRVNTEYTMFLGADNWLRSDAIEILSGHDEDVITYDIMITGNLKDEFFRPNWMGPKVMDRGDIIWRRNSEWHGSMVYRTEMGKKVGYTRNQEFPYEDLYMWGGLKKLGAKIKYIPEPLLMYRRHKENFLPMG